jgi:hypothetical protein
VSAIIPASRPDPVGECFTLWATADAFLTNPRNCSFAPPGRAASMYKPGVLALAFVLSASGVSVRAWLCTRPDP